MDAPLVSCIMPTADRRGQVPRAIAYFLRQDYPNKELVILDDGRNPIADLVPDDSQIRYVRLDRPVSLGVKRNLSVEAARGDLIMHWDDDDWYSPHRIRYQVEALLEAGAEVCGLRRILFHEPATDETWLYDYTDGSRPWLAGGSLLYTRDFWRRAPFPDVRQGEDTRFVWSHDLRRAAVLPDLGLYVAMIHPGNTSPKQRRGAYWSRWDGDIAAILGPDLAHFGGKPGGTGVGLSPDPPNAGGHRAPPEIGGLRGALAPADRPPPPEIGGLGEPPTYAILMVAHNAREVVQMSTQRTLRHSAGQPARLVVVDGASDDGTEMWLDVLARRGDIDLIRAATNIGHGPGLQLAQACTVAPYIVTLDSDAFPLADDWLPRLRGMLAGDVKLAGIRHHRDYIHPSCLMIERRTLDEWGVTFLNEKDRPSRFDVAERISHEARRRGYRIAGLTRTGAQRRGSVSEPVYLGAEYDGVVYHQWYTTRAATAASRPVDDVPQEALDRSLAETLAAYRREPRPVTVVLGVRASPAEPERLRNALACLWALNLQDLPRWYYRIVAVEQDAEPQLERALAPLVDRYIFARNPGPYNRGWAFNVGAVQAGADSEVLCLIDADLLVPADFLSRGLAAAREGLAAFLPYSEVAYLDARATEAAISDRLTQPAAPVDHQALGVAAAHPFAHGSRDERIGAGPDLRSAVPLRLGSTSGLPPGIVPGALPRSARGDAPAFDGHTGRIFTTAEGGCVWVEPGLYLRAHGHDERFRGWGYEDRDFWARLSKQARTGRLPGGLLHLDHPRPRMDDRCAAANRQLANDPGTSAVGPIGDPQRYATETGVTVTVPARADGAGPYGSWQAAPTAQVGHPAGGSTLPSQRDWEHWQCWSPQRIEQIVGSERALPVGSARARLAELIAGLGGSVLDAGCGPGALWPRLAACVGRPGPRLSWSGLDVTLQMLAAGQRLFPEVPLYQGDVAALPFADGSFDTVLLRHVLEHLPPGMMEAAVREALRVARQAVVLDFFITPTWSAEPLTRRVGEGFLETRWEIPRLAALITETRWRVTRRCNLVGGPGEVDLVWVLQPATATKDGVLPEIPKAGLRPLVSIVMPTFRRPHTIQRTLGTILNQTYPDWELIIVDNAGDCGLRVKDPRVRICRHNERASASYARNRGLQYAGGDIVSFFDDDDDMYPTYLESFVAAFLAHPAAKMVRCGMMVSNGQVNYSYATPECCVRRAFATPTWRGNGAAQDQDYFRSLEAANRWSEADGDIVLIPEPLCRANSDPRGGLRAGHY